MLQRVCPVCGKTFETDSIRQKYCGKECKCRVQWERRRAKATVYHKACQVCGKPFDTHYERQKYCCKKCGEIAHGRAQKMRKYCEWCGKPFVAERANKRFCCQKCAGLCYRSHMSDEQKQKRRDAARRIREMKKIKKEAARTIESYHSERLDKLIEGDGGYNYGKNRAKEFLEQLPPIDLNV